MTATIVGVDVGGTFTDLFVLDERTGQASIVKVPSSRGAEARGFIDGIERISGGAAALTTIVHGTTVATNALLERRVAKTGMITTRGFRDVLEMRRRDRPQTWGLTGSYQPVIPRDLRLEVDERVLADGSEHTEINLDQVRDAAHALLAAGCQAVCIFFINAYANPRNEQRAVAAVRALWPNPHVTASHEVLPEIREFERCSTASLNACLQPVVGDYLRGLNDDLRKRGFAGDLLIVQSSGGVMSVAAACQVPVRTALSGPAAGVIACAQIAQACGITDLITGDVGGTSFDVSLIADGKAALAAQTAIEFGMVIRAPMIQIETIGAGGGSIASVDGAGLLHVGPRSAGSVPGPACYGRGGLAATLTDANVLLGRIDGTRPIGGGLLGKLDLELARAAIARDVAQPLGLDVLQAAEAILTVANAKMAGAIRLVSIERGHDPRKFAYMPFGGGGALHVCAMLRDVGVVAALIPRYPGVTSALGCVLADLRHDMVQTLSCALADMGPESLRQRINEMADACAARIDASGVRIERRIESIELDMLYVGQTHTLAVPIDRQNLDRDALLAAFERSYQASFGRVLSGIAVRVVNLRYALVAVRPKFDLAVLAPDALQMPAVSTRRAVYHAGRWHETPVWPRLQLPVGAQVQGPAIFEQADTTVWLEPGFGACVDRFGNLLVSASQERSVDGVSGREDGREGEREGRRENDGDVG